MPEAWQHAVNHWLDVVSAFSGLSLGLGYGALVLALPLLLLPTAFPELSRPRDAIWSLLLAALAPLLLLNRPPVFSSAGFGELIATVLMARLAAEVGQGRWESLTPDQRSALRHLPRWRRAGADLVAAVVQAAKDTWSGTAQAGKAAWGAVLGQNGPVEQRHQEQSAQKPARKEWVRPDPSDGAQDDQDGETSPEIPDVAPAMGASPGSAADNVPDAEPSQPVDGGDGSQAVEGASVTLKDAATGGSGEATPEQEHRAGTGLVAAVVQAVKNTWGAVSGQNGPVEQRHQEQSAQKPARKEWVRPDPSDGAQDDQDGETSPEIPDVAPAMGTSPGSAADNAPDAEPSQPVDGGDGDQGGEATPEQEHPDKPTADGLVTTSLEDAAPEEHSAPEPAEEAHQAQPVDGDTLGDRTGADAAPEAVEHPVEPPEPEAQPSDEGAADAAGPEPEHGESAPEEPSTPEPAEGAQPAQSLDDGDGDPGHVKGTDAAAGDVAPEAVEHPVELPEPEAQPSEGVGADAASPEPESRESAPEEPSTPELAEGTQPAQSLDDGDGDPGHVKGTDAAAGGVALEDVEHPVEPPEPEAQPSEGGADAASPEPEPRESAPEEPSTPEPAEGAQPAQSLDDGDGDPGHVKGIDAAPGDVALEAVERPVEPPESETQPSEGGADAAGPEPEPRESAPEEPSIPEPAEGAQPAQPLDGTDKPKASQADSPSQDADNSAPMAVALDDDPGDVAAADERGEGFVAANTDTAAGTPQATTDASGAEAEPAQSAGEGSPQPAQAGEDVVVSSFDEVDEKLREAN